MKTSRFLSTLCLTLSLVLPFAAMRAADLDYGDNAPATLVNKGWKALNDKNFKDAVSYASKCIDLYTQKAADQQRALSAIHPKNLDSWAVENVGIAYLIRGRAKEGLEKIPDALKDYKTLMEKFDKAEPVDAGKNKWRPATVAAERTIALGGQLPAGVPTPPPPTPVPAPAGAKPAAAPAPADPTATPPPSSMPKFVPSPTPGASAAPAAPGEVPLPPM